MQILWAECSVEASQDQEESEIEQTVYCMTDDCKHFRIAASKPILQFQASDLCRKRHQRNLITSQHLYCRQKTSQISWWNGHKVCIAGVNLHRFAFKLDCTVHLAENLPCKSSRQTADELTTSMQECSGLPAGRFHSYFCCCDLELQSALLAVTLLFAASRINEGRLKLISATSWQRLQNIGYSLFI